MDKKLWTIFKNNKHLHLLLYTFQKKISTVPNTKEFLNKIRLTRIRFTNVQEEVKIEKLVQELFR
jgi:hypothetical protein